MIKYRTIYILFLVVLGLTMQSCQEEPDELNGITFENLSDETLYIGVRIEDAITPQIMFDYEAYEDITILIFKHEKCQCLSISSKYDNSIHLLIYKQSTLDKYTTDELVEQNIYDKRYDLTYDELKAMNFTIVYTGD